MINENFTIAMWIITFIAFTTVWFHITNHRTDALMNYGDCVIEQMQGTSIPYEDAWLIYQNVCQK